jgi:hypothetical protein
LRPDDVIPGDYGGIPGGNTNEYVNGCPKQAIIPEDVAEAIRAEKNPRQNSSRR